MNEPELAPPGPPVLPELIPAPFQGVPPIKRLTHKERATIIKKIGSYYGVNYIIATEKYNHLKSIGAVEDILTKYAQGEKLERPVCPACGGDMIKRRASWGGEFWGCILYPSCRGLRQILSEIKDVTDAQRAETIQKTTAALDFIKAIGGIEEARRWINIAAVSLENRKPDAVP